jgi:hypothetical protein
VEGARSFAASPAEGQLCRPECREPYRSARAPRSDLLCYESARAGQGHGLPWARLARVRPECLRSSRGSTPGTVAAERLACRRSASLVRSTVSHRCRQGGEKPQRARCPHALRRGGDRFVCPSAQPRWRGSSRWFRYRATSPGQMAGISALDPPSEARSSDWMRQRLSLATWVEVDGESLEVIDTGRERFRRRGCAIGTGERPVLSHRPLTSRCGRQPLWIWIEPPAREVVGSVVSPLPIWLS